MNQRAPSLLREDAFFVVNGDRGLEMVELKIALMVAMMAILFFATYFTAIPG